MPPSNNVTFLPGHAPIAEFSGLSRVRMTNWLSAPFDELSGVTINTPQALNSSPVMRYLEVILDALQAEDGSFKATPKGNIPAKVVNQASALLPEFAVAPYNRVASISEFCGSNEDKFNALHYTRILAELAGIIYRRSGRYHFKKRAQKQYQAQGLPVFFKPMLEAAVYRYNWGYLDGWPEHAELSHVWLFMIWRLQSHRSVVRLADEVARAFPELSVMVKQRDYVRDESALLYILDCRLIRRFLEFWGFVLSPDLMSLQADKPVTLLPLFEQTFCFEV